MRVRVEHWHVILDACEKNPELITNKFNGREGKVKGHALWRTVSHKLNSLGFGEKSVEGWRRALIDWKSKTKAKAAKIKKAILKAGGGPAHYIPLSDLESRLLEIMGLKAFDKDDMLGLGQATMIESETCKESNNEKYEEKYCPKIESPGLSFQATAVPSTSDNISYEPFPEIHIESNVDSPVRSRETERLSQKLININEESLQYLRSISENMESMADSLKTMTAIIQQHFGT